MKWSLERNTCSEFWRGWRGCCIKGKQGQVISCYCVVSQALGTPLPPPLTFNQEILIKKITDKCTLWRAYSLINNTWKNYGPFHSIQITYLLTTGTFERMPETMIGWSIRVRNFNILVNLVIQVCKFWSSYNKQLICTIEYAGTHWKR